jgi:hypothetical protein
MITQRVFVSTYTKGVGKLRVLKGVTVPIRTVGQTKWFTLEVDVVTVGRPYLLRLDSRHNQAEVQLRVICICRKAGACE